MPCVIACYLLQSVDNEIVLWEPKTKEQSPGEGAVDILQKYPVPECDIWFIKFSCDFHYNAAAIALYLAVARMVPYGVGIWCHEDDVLLDLLEPTRPSSSFLVSSSPRASEYHPSLRFFESGTGAEHPNGSVAGALATAYLLTWRRRRLT
ncbi:hypothetical protein ZIOFF_060258 [Zingiber officinale]|uniref:Uncharacterized protein n=1 Tax=Zingiber officinale TaxID=94328 RepID=A0A8J5FBA7_ZINOF|nr:hypothetical protein ZIOFF_060258 [Zingiber officinale]